MSDESEQTNEHRRKILTRWNTARRRKSDKEARAWLERHERRSATSSAARGSEPASWQYFEIIDPRDGEGSRASRKAAPPMSTPPSKRRAQALPRMEALTPAMPRALSLCARAPGAETLAAASPCSRRMDNGKPIRETRDIDIPLVARHFYHHAGWAQLLDQRISRLRALGVVGQIIPWNFPLLMLAWKIAPAMALGNTVVLKPAEFTPLTALLFRRNLSRRRDCPPAWSTS